MTDLQYVVELYDINQPLFQGLYWSNINQFIILYMNTESDFRKWMDKHDENINKLSDTELDNIFSTYVNPDIKPNRISLMLSMKDDDITKLIGGSIDSIKFCAGVVYYLFGDIRSKLLPKPKNKKQTGGVTLSDLSGTTKADLRVVILIGINNKKYIIKIVPAEDSYLKEIEIYHKLTELAKQDPIIQTIKMYHNGKVERNVDNSISFTVNGTKLKIPQTQFPKLYQNIDDLIEWTYTITQEQNMTYFSCLEYYDGYVTLMDCFEQVTVDNDKRCTLAERVIKMLAHMNKRYGFFHGDFHVNNLLVDPTTFDFKLFDYDTSSMDGIYHSRIFRQSSILNELLVANGGSETIAKQIGLVHDVNRFFYDGDFDQVRQDCRVKLLIVNVQNARDSIIQSMSEEELSSLKNQFRIIYPTTKKLFENHFYDLIMSQQIGGQNYYYKYVKYKTKYMNLKYVR